MSGAYASVPGEAPTTPTSLERISFGRSASIEQAGTSNDNNDDAIEAAVPKPSPATSDDNLRKEIGLLSASSIIIGQVVGSGIYSTPASVALLCGTPAMALILWLISGVVSLGGALASAELGTMFPQNGGMIRYLAHAYPRPRAL
ncbi:hypothetical protein GGH95_005311, partial [Coemansia sp. RSA 1836]